MHRCFPNCHLYAINFAPGTCGSLISSLIYCMLFPNESLKEEQDLSNAHDTLLNAVVQVWDDQSIVDLGYDKEDYRFQIRFGGKVSNFLLPVLNEPAGINAYQRVSPKNKNGFVIVIDHTTIYNYESLVSVYPNFTEFLITIKPEDRNQHDFTVFLKFMCELEGEPLIETWNIMQRVVLNRNPEYIWITDYENPKDILSNKEHFHLFVKSYFGTPTNFENFGKFDSRNFNKRIEKNIKFKDRIHSIDFKTIMTNPNSILNQISNILQKPISDSARLVYDRWISKQVLLESILDK